MSEDDRWNEIIDQVMDALDDADVADSSTRDALAEGVRQALESLETGVGLDVQILGEGFPTQAPEPVSVEVVDGGRTEDTPRTDSDIPDLRIADTEEVEADAIETPPMFTHVKVTRDGNPPSRRSRPLPGLSEAGWIHVAAAEGPETAWQTLYVGRTPRLYRIACSQGLLDVTADGEPVERLSPGQSIDIEAESIRVTTAPNTEAIGGYTPLGINGAEE